MTCTTYGGVALVTGNNLASSTATAKSNAFLDVDRPLLRVGVYVEVTTITVHFSVGCGKCGIFCMFINNIWGMAGNVTGGRVWNVSHVMQGCMCGSYIKCIINGCSAEVTVKAVVIWMVRGIGSSCFMARCTGTSEGMV